MQKKNYSKCDLHSKNWIFCQYHVLIIEKRVGFRIFCNVECHFTIFFIRSRDTRISLYLKILKSRI